jgi:hypothetical protein
MLWHHRAEKLWKVSGTGIEQVSPQLGRRIMRYVVYKTVHGENVRWYARPLTEGELAPYPLIFLGDNARLLACEKARELNERIGKLALAA